MFDPVTRMRADLAEVATEERAGWPPAAQSARVRELAELQERVDAELIRAVAQWDAGSCWAVDGALSPVSWLTDRTPMGRAAAHRLVRCGDLVRTHERTADALSSGAVSSERVRTIAAVTRQREDLYAEGEEALLAAAATLGHDEFQTAARYWRSLADDAAGNSDAFAQHERRFLHTSKTLFGSLRLDGELDLESGETLLNALAAVEGVARGDLAADTCTGGQRNADNLVQLAAAFLAGDRHDVTAERPSIAAALVVDVERLSEGVGTASGLVDTRCELAHLGPIAQATARRLTCDASVARVLMAGRSEVLDQGRSTRVVSKAQRRALVVRDRGCVFPGCDRPPDWCDAHHVRHWSDGGSTDLANLVLLCRRHHVLCHEGGWQLARGPDGEVRARRDVHDGGGTVSIAA